MTKCSHAFVDIHIYEIGTRNGDGDAFWYDFFNKLNVERDVNKEEILQIEEVDTWKQLL
jgi:hypothetical protein